MYLKKQFNKGNRKCASVLGMFIISLALIFNLCACDAPTSLDNAPTSSDAPETPSIAGVWKGEMFGATMLYIFNEDGTYENYSDKTTIKGKGGTYTYDTDTGEISFGAGETGVNKITVNGEKMILTTTTDTSVFDSVFTRLYPNKQESSLLGSWKADGSKTSMRFTFNGNGIYKLEYATSAGTGSTEGAYTYDAYTGKLTFHDIGDTQKAIITDSAMYWVSDDGLMSLKRQ